MKFLKPPRARAWWRSLEGGSERGEYGIQNKTKRWLYGSRMYLNGIRFLHMVLPLDFFIRHYIFDILSMLKKCSSNSYIHFNCSVVSHYFTITSNAAMNRLTYRWPTPICEILTWGYTCKCVCWAESMYINVTKYCKMAPYCNDSNYHSHRLRMKASISDSLLLPQWIRLGNFANLMALKS